MPERQELITLTEAAELLQYKSFRRVNTLVKSGKLKAYKVPAEKYKLVSREDVLAMNNVEEWKYGTK